MRLFLLLLLSFSAFAYKAPFKDSSLNSFKYTKSFNGVLFNETSPEVNSWIHQDSKGQIQGVSTNLYYKNSNVDSKNTIVAVIDSGVDVNHEDLDGKIWINTKEIPNNNLDDDNNGYIDDVMGWNFIGDKDQPSIFKISKDKKNGLVLINNPLGQVEFDSFEITRELKRLLVQKKKLILKNISIPKILNQKIQKLNDQIESKHIDSIDSYNFFVKELKVFLSFSKQVKKEFKLSSISLESLESIQDKNSKVFKLIELFETYDNPEVEINKGLHYFNGIANYHYNIDSDVRALIVKDKDEPQFYGNNNVIGPDSYHGTHVAGIIAATRDNNLGINGISQNAIIMPLRVVPNGDERDKDVANAIRYAVDNGAKIINMSFGKSISPIQKLVAQAIRYADSKNVLLVHAAGNENLNIDQVDNFPSAIYRNKKSANWIEVGASNKYNANLFANFSNYGQDNVDIFAPGVDIVSTSPNNTYSKSSGTSMASPVVSGLAAIILGSYPKLKPEQVKDILLAKSNRYPLLYTYNPAQRANVLFSKLSKSGSIPNIFKAMNYLSDYYDEINYFSSKE